MAKKHPGSGRVERDAKTGEYVKKGTEQKHPERTVTEPRRTKKK